MNTILCINGSDSLGHSGIQADVRTVRDLGGYAVTAVTSVTVQTETHINDIHELPTELVIGQVNAIYKEVNPTVVKIGMINSPSTIHAIKDEVIRSKHVICSPVILSSHGGCLMSNDSIRCFCKHLVPLSTLLMLKCTDAEIILGKHITTDDDMLSAAHSFREMGAQWVLLRGGTYIAGRINALLLGQSHQAFFSSVNIQGWQRHGVGGTLSTAIAARVAMGDDIPDAVSHAHEYLHSQVVYASAGRTASTRPSELYDSFISLISSNYRQAHDVSFYADELSITSRYLSQITNAVSGNSPKQIIDAYILKAAEQLLRTTTMTIQETAHTLGFSSQIAFAKFFRSKKGIPPTTFRNNP